jgi:hypothetical protein
MEHLMFRYVRRTLASVFGAAAALAAGMTAAAADPAAQVAVAARDTGANAANGLVIGMLLAFALGWVVIELRRASHS